MSFRSSVLNILVSTVFFVVAESAFPADVSVIGGLPPSFPAGSSAIAAQRRDGYKLTTGDRLSISVFEKENLRTKDVPVDSKGNIQVSGIAQAVHVSGLSVAEVQTLLEGEYEKQRLATSPIVAITVAENRNRPLIPASPAEALAIIRGLVPEATLIDAQRLRSRGGLSEVFPAIFSHPGAIAVGGTLYLFGDHSYLSVWFYANGFRPKMPYSVEEGVWSYADGTVSLLSKGSTGKSEREYLLIHQSLRGEDEILLVGVHEDVEWINAQAGSNPDPEIRQRLLESFSYKRGQSISAEKTRTLKATLPELPKKTWDQVMPTDIPDP